MADVNGSQLKRYWSVGEGGKKIRWNTPGDFTRCVRHLRKYIRDPEGYCANLHKAMTGTWPGSAANVGNRKKKG